MTVTYTMDDERPSDIPADVWAAALEVGELIPSGPGPASITTAGDIARAILAERERCKRLAHAESTRREGAGAEAALEIALAILTGEQP